MCSGVKADLEDVQELLVSLCLPLSLFLSPGLWCTGITPYTARLCAPDSCGGQEVSCRPRHSGAQKGKYSKQEKGKAIGTIRPVMGGGKTEKWLAELGVKRRLCTFCGKDASDRRLGK